MKGRERRVAGIAAAIVMLVGAGGCARPGAPAGEVAPGEGTPSERVASARSAVPSARSWPPKQHMGVRKGPRTIGVRVHLVDARQGGRAGAGRVGARRRYSLPVPDSMVTEADLRAPHHDYPASDLMVPPGTPLFAVHGGRVTVHRGRRCGEGVSIEGDDRHRYVYCHLSVVAVGTGDRVEAGDVLGLSGDTGNAIGVPHLHFHIRAPGGAYVCPQPAFLAWWAGNDVSPREAGPWGRCWFPRDS